ncbi:MULTISPECIES: excalibur calcium-binding domain-containing protein [Pseudoalteromonas]|uniref:Excalibur calcium-binding domain-containing protein n=1 Tax=Pseudoalteromonas amylolytica TaxID=1859457 RepID=A0A1S1N1S1_9GAMM|nr:MULTISPECIES: excalibur calcium-binding domain-containing protein [Pseudoalteromonas]OHU90826.1 hypothetical protein BFC16_04305 [Pseudoalteromonas sp. JW3]OHU92554.1 hypothetical protein BET10_03585 [Pseudoalteromonas amylolytica]
MIKNSLISWVLLTVSYYSIAEETWRGLVVEQENRCSPYNKKAQYPYPQSVEDEIVASMGGVVYGPYTGSYFESDTDTDIEHIVAASEGHDSGLCAASDEMRVQFATDLLNLTLAAPVVNRCNVGGKCGYDAGEWMPEKNQCWFSNRVLQIKTKYRLSVDRNEAEVLERTLSACSSFEMIFYPHSELGNSDQEDDKQRSPLEMYDDNNNGRISCSEAKKHKITPVLSQHPAYQFMRDSDGDGIVCEN